MSTDYDAKYYRNKASEAERKGDYYQAATLYLQAADIEPQLYYFSKAGSLFTKASNSNEAFNAYLRYLKFDNEERLLSDEGLRDLHKLNILDSFLKESAKLNNVNHGY